MLKKEGHPPKFESVDCWCQELDYSILKYHQLSNPFWLRKNAPQNRWNSRNQNMCWARPAYKYFLHSKNGIKYNITHTLPIQYRKHYVNNWSFFHSTTTPYTLCFRTSGRDCVDVRVHNVIKATVVQLQTWFKKNDYAVGEADWSGQCRTRGAWRQSGRYKANRKVWTTQLSNKRQWILV